MDDRLNLTIARIRAKHEADQYGSEVRTTIAKLLEEIDRQHKEIVSLNTDLLFWMRRASN